MPTNPSINILISVTTMKPEFQARLSTCVGINCVLWVLLVPAIILISVACLKHETNLHVVQEPVHYSLPMWANALVIQSMEIDLYGGTLFVECVSSDDALTAKNCTCYDPTNQEDSNSVVRSLNINVLWPPSLTFWPGANCTDVGGYHAHLMLMPRWYVLLGLVSGVAVLLSCCVGCTCLTDSGLKHCPGCCFWIADRKAVKYRRIEDLAMMTRPKFQFQKHYGTN
jgi:hypothetical protein